MKIGKKLKRKMIDLTLKTPLVSLAIIAITMLSIYWLISTHDTNVYVKLDGDMYSSKDNMLIKASLNRKYYSQIKEGSQVLWFIDAEGVRHAAKICEVEPPEGQKFFILIQPERADYERELKTKDNPVNQKVNVEVLIKKIKIIEKLFLDKTGDQDEK